MTLRQAHHELSVATRSRGLFDVTAALRGFLQAEHARDGLLTVFIRHTSASLVVQENASSDVRVDLERFFAELVPDGDPRFTHTDEGPDDMPSHLRMVLTRTSEVVPLAGGRMQLGTWQGIFLFEHRRHTHRRNVVVTVLGTAG